MKCFINVFKADLKRFLITTWKLYIAFSVYCIMHALIFYSDMRKLLMMGRVNNVSLGDSIICFFKGVKEYHPENKVAMDIPLLEIFVLLFLLFIIAYYINSDAGALEKSIMIISKSPVYWWISKCVITILAAVLYFMLIILALAINGVIVLSDKFNLNMKFSSYENISKLLGEMDIPNDISAYSLVGLSFLCIVTASVIMLFVTYVFNSVYGFIINLIIFIFSICYMKWITIYNYMMMYRMAYVYGERYLGLIMMIVIDCLLIIIGTIYSRKRDFL